MGKRRAAHGVEVLVRHLIETDAPRLEAVTKEGNCLAGRHGPVGALEHFVVANEPICQDQQS